MLLNVSGGVKRTENLPGPMKAQRHLHSIEPRLHSKYLDAADCTEPSGWHSPHRIGLWMGIQIVDAYVRKYPETTYNELLSYFSYEQFFMDSGFAG